MTAASITLATAVDKRSRRAMTAFLAGHYRYHTMNGWNDATSYANNVKITHVLPSSLYDRAFELLEVEDAFDDIGHLLAEWDAEHGHRWQAWFNGRSNGYIVLGQGGARPSQHKRICRTCGQKNFRADATVCGRCHSENMHDYVGTDVFVQPGLGYDHRFTAEDYAELSMSDLRDRTELVQSFDRLCDDVVATFIALCENYTVEEETVLVPTTIKVLHEVGS